MIDFKKAGEMNFFTEALHWDSKMRVSDRLSTRIKCKSRAWVSVTWSAHSCTLENTRTRDWNIAQRHIYKNYCSTARKSKSSIHQFVKIYSYISKFIRALMNSFIDWETLGIDLGALQVSGKNLPVGYHCSPRKESVKDMNQSSWEFFAWHMKHP